MLASPTPSPSPRELAEETLEPKDEPARTSTPATTPTPSPAPEANAAPKPPPNLGAAPLALLDQLHVAPEGPRAGYDRDLFRLWIDADGDGCDTRREVLMDESLNAVSSCSLAGGRWFSAYDGVATTDPSTFDVDHVVALAEAWDSGGSPWASSRRQEFANDLGYDGSLIAVSASSNRSKSDRDPAEWKPPRRDYWCTYAVTWVNVKIRWALTADSSEVAALTQMLGRCPADSAQADTGPAQPPPPPPPPPEPTQAPPPPPSTQDLVGHYRTPGGTTSAAAT